MTAIDRKAQTITLTYQPIHDASQATSEHTLPYDILILAIGSVSNNYNTPGADEHCYYLDSLQEAEQFQRFFLNQMITMQEISDTERSTHLDVVIVGAGATGVELSAELHYALKQAYSYGLTHASHTGKIKITLIEAADRILAALPKRISELTLKELKQLEINVSTNERVTEVTQEGIKTASGKFIPAQLKIWAAGIRGADILNHLDGLETNKNNRLLVKQTLQTTLDDNVFALGDCSACPLSDTGKFVPARAQAAHQEASLLAKSIMNILDDKPPLEYQYRDYGSLISLSRKGTVGNLMGKTLKNVLVEGWLARLFYLSLYKMHQVTVRGLWRVIVMTLAKRITRRIKPKLKLH